jgi:hypothetical protein
MSASSNSTCGGDGGDGGDGGGDDENGYGVVAQYSGKMS